VVLEIELVDGALEIELVDGVLEAEFVDGVLEVEIEDEVLEGGTEGYQVFTQEQADETQTGFEVQAETNDGRPVVA
jgi:hypothetical protein